MQQSPSFIPPKYEASVLIKWVHYFLHSGAEQIVIKERHGTADKKLKACILWGAQETAVNSKLQSECQWLWSRLSVSTNDFELTHAPP